MNYTELRRASLKIFLGFLGLTAIIAILCVVAGDFGELSFKVLITTFTISAASISSMSCAAFIEKRRRTQLGLAGIFLSVAAAILLISGLWLESNSDVYWKTTTTFTVLAVALAQAFLLALPELDLRQTWIQPVTSVSIGILALQIIVAVWGRDRCGNLLSISGRCGDPCGTRNVGGSHLDEAAKKKWEKKRAARFGENPGQSL